MPDWLLQFLLATAGALIIAAGTKKISAQSSKIERLRSEYELDRTKLQGQHTQEIAVLRQQILSLTEGYERVSRELQEMRAVYIPAQATLQTAIRIRDDYIGVLRHGYRDLDSTPPAYPPELRDHV